MASRPNLKSYILRVGGLALIYLVVVVAAKIFIPEHIETSIYVVTFFVFIFAIYESKKEKAKKGSVPNGT